jgi:hypothetical protein
MQCKNIGNMFGKNVQRQCCRRVVGHKAIAVVSDVPLRQSGWEMVLPLALGWVALVTVVAKFEVFGGLWACWAVGR